MNLHLRFCVCLPFIHPSSHPTIHPSVSPSILSPIHPSTQIEYNRQKMDVDARLTKALVSNLRPNTTYEFGVTCQENTEGGARHRVVTKTAPAILVKKPKLDIYTEPEHTLTMVFPPVEGKDIK